MAFEEVPSHQIHLQLNSAQKEVISAALSLEGRITDNNRQTSGNTDCILSISGFASLGYQKSWSPQLYQNNPKGVKNWTSAPFREQRIYGTIFPYEHPKWPATGLCTTTPKYARTLLNLVLVGPCNHIAVDQR